MLPTLSTASVISRHCGPFASCPLCPQQRTFVRARKDVRFVPFNGHPWRNYMLCSRVAAPQHSPVLNRSSILSTTRSNWSRSATGYAMARMFTMRSPQERRRDNRSEQTTSGRGADR